MKNKLISSDHTLRSLIARNRSRLFETIDAIKQTIADTDEIVSTMRTQNQGRTITTRQEA